MILSLLLCPPHCKMETLSTAIMVTGVPKKEHRAAETNYVDLGHTNAVKVSLTVDGNQRAVIQSEGNHEEHEEGRTDQRKFDKHVSTHIPLVDLKTETSLKRETAVTSPEETDYTDMYLNSRCESESDSENGDRDGSEEDVPVSQETESHYITTHEIQLTELDHDMDHELGRAASSCWDYEDENLVYTFVDYASFTSGEQPSGERGQRRAASNRPPKLAATKSLISTESECASSDDGVCNTSGRIHVSIKAASQTVSESIRPSLDENKLLRCYRETQTKTDALYDSHAHCFIPAPGRQHLASKLMKGKDITEYSSGGSSSVSELDDADKEVRNLTAKSFRSLACPYFDTIDLRPSSESSVSENSLSMNKWSSFIDFNYRNYVTEARNHQTNALSSKSNQSCNTERQVKCAQDSDQACVCMEGVHKKAAFASSLLQNVISKKMQFDQNHKLECGDGRGAQTTHSATKDNTSSNSLQRQTSKSGSEHSAVSVEEAVESSNAVNDKEEWEESPKASCKPTTENIDEFPPASLLEDNGVSAEISKTGVPELNCERAVTETTALVEKANACRLQRSHLYVSGSHFLSKENDVLTPSAPMKQTMVPHSDGNGVSDADKTPEITIRLRSIKENNPQHPFNIASLLTPNLTKYSGDPKSEKVPHFTVRDVRNSRCKLQTPIHQVRDVRKLVKSSYRFVSLERGDNKTASREESDGVKKDPDKNDKNEKTAMVIKCHSVNTNAVTKTNPSQNRQNDLESERSRMQTISERQELQIKSSRWKEGCDKRVECKMTNQVALEKLKAAVKSMEQLYVFDRNEWRRKTEAPWPLTDSHVLSLIAREEQGVDNETITTGTVTGTVTRLQQASSKTQCSNISSSTRNPLSLQICPSNTMAPQRVGDEAEVTESENYLTIPIKPQRSQTKPHASEQTLNPPPQPQLLPRPPVVTESWPPKTLCQPAQILCVTPPTDTLPSNTQRKLLLDPLTGQCYLVDTPTALQPVTQRLYCPDSAQYLDVPLALSPSAYLICPPPFVQRHSVTVYSHGESTSTGPSMTTGGVKPVISITSQQGPHIVAPPSFDGTTMSFVVEHR